MTSTGLVSKCGPRLFQIPTVRIGMQIPVVQTMAEIDPLDPDTTRLLSELPYNYPEIGATGSERLPAGYRTLREHRDLDGGRSRFDRLREDLLTWQLHRRSGLAVRASSPRVRQDAVVVATLRLGPAPIRTRCRVVYVVDEPDRAGFAYGTLPGHPEAGEERFLVELLADDRVRFSLTAFSRNAGLLARLGGPISRRVQTMVNDRYLRAAGL